MKQPFSSSVLVLFLILASCGSGGGGDGPTLQPLEPGSPPTDAGLAVWEAEMRTLGRRHCDFLTAGAADFDPLLAATYYDADWVFQRVARYTGDRTWLECASAARRVYRDQYVLKYDGKMPGYWLFPHGIRDDALSSGDSLSAKAVMLLSQNGAFASDGSPLAQAVSTEQSREVAYAIMTLLAAERVGMPRRDRLPALVELAFGHLDQWFGVKSAPYIRPFMVALTAQSLIEWHAATGDGRVLPALIEAADSLWHGCWVEEAKAFKYTDRSASSGGPEPAPDLNLLIAPLYGWLYRMTGDDRYGAAGDKIFEGGVLGAYLNSPKHFNQNYRWSFDFVRWRYELEKKRY